MQNKQPHINPSDVELKSTLFDRIKFRSLKLIPYARERNVFGVSFPVAIDINSEIITTKSTKVNFTLSLKVNVQKKTETK